MRNLADLFWGLRDHHGSDAEVDEGELATCLNCQAALAGSRDYSEFRVCPSCRFHYTIGAPERIDLLVDSGTFRETQRSLISIDPLSFAGQASYRHRIFDEQRRTGLSDAIITGTASIRGEPIVLAVIDFRFLGGSLGCVVGERLTLALELAARRKLPAVVIVASGGIRIQEGLLSLVQVAKMVAAAERLGAAGLPLISLLANPTIGAAYAGFVGLSDIIAAEPGAIVGYSTTRALEESSGGHLPHGSHTAEFQLEHGLIDRIVDRAQQRDFLAGLLAMLASSYRLTSTRNPARVAAPAGTAVAWNQVQLARHEQRPTALEYIGRMTNTFIELKGDRIDGDDSAVVCGIGQIGGESVVLIGQERQHGHAAPIRPEGFRKARRAMLLAGKLGLPVITLIDTAGAAVDVPAEQHGLGSAVANCLATASALEVPSVGVIIGEGGNEAALAFGVANRLLMMENAVFTPISPEIAASILYRDASKAEAAAAALRLTASDCARLGIIDGIIAEPVGGAHAAHEEASRELKQAILQELTDIQRESPRSLVNQRYRKLRNRGRYSNYLGMRIRRELSDLRDAVCGRVAHIASKVRRARPSESESSDEGMLIP
ncbi:MAG TPA: acetyl-CoA carboxylase carboxyltransferase subunit alpha/beta [Dehalococcoidia bacterium]|nr:acetyl-CoA carboxylase carboxyltransferase subunit alpha/beta [Dehalococcoidia bacterium]